MNRRRWPALLGVALVVVLLALAACSSDGADNGGEDDDGDGSPATSDNGDGQPTDEDDATVDGEATDRANPDAVGEVNACDLLTVDEIEAATDATYASGVRDDFPPFYNCRFGSASGQFVAVSVTVYPDGDTAASSFDLAVTANDFPEVGDLGERAYDSRPVGDVTALQGRYELSVDVFTGGEDDGFEIARELAAIGLERLP